MKTFPLLSLIMFLSSNAFAQFVSTDHCVAWKAHKTMFLFNDVEPIGKNCSITATAKSESAKTTIEVKIPIKSFNSGEPDRDAEVFEILKGEVSPNLNFVSTPLSQGDLTKLKVGGSLQLKGQLEIGKKEYTITFNITSKVAGEKITITGKSTTSFSKLGLEAPSVAGGIVASVDDYLELHLHLDASKISNLNLKNWPI